MREKTIEDFLCDRTLEQGGIAEKWGIGGWPDRLLLCPGGRVGFLELKRPGEKPTPRQYARLRTLLRLGFNAGWADSHQGVADFVRSVQ